jgi:citrate lyase subunit beta / citryl-CoA lyase
MGEIITVGNKGKTVRSDCFVTLEPKEKGGIDIRLDSKVAVMYGASITTLAREMLDFFGVRDASLIIEDSGALPWVLSARIEAAVKKALKPEKEFIPSLLKENEYSTPRDKNRFSRLYLPGNAPGLMINAGIHNPDGIILDLEDAVAPDKKDESRYLVRNALCALNFYGAERMVRINQGERGIEDLGYIIPHNVNLILLPKCEKPEHIRDVNQRIEQIKKKNRIKNQIWLMPIIESALGVVNAYPLATAADNVVAMAIGLEDYTADLGTKRTTEGTESFFARSMVVNAARAAGIQPIDSVFSDVGDSEGLKQTVLRSKALGFDGMGCIHPRQIRIIHQNFAPSSDETEKAKKIVFAYHKALAQGLGVVALGTKMIDPPVVKRALNTINLAIKMGKLSENWRETYDQV